MVNFATFGWPKISCHIPNFCVDTWHNCTWRTPKWTNLMLEGRHVDSNLVPQGLGGSSTCELELLKCQKFWSQNFFSSFSRSNQIKSLSNLQVEVLTCQSEAKTPGSEWRSGWWSKSKVYRKFRDDNLPNTWNLYHPASPRQLAQHAH